MNNIVQRKLVINRIIKFLTLLFLVSFFGACSKTQDDVDLPVFDALGGEFTLPSSLGREVSLSEYNGKVVLLNFGFTNCPDICPVVLTRLVKLTKALQEQHGIGVDKVQTLFVTVDPERDTAEHLKQYLKFYNADFIGLTGTVEQTSGVSKQYAAYREKQAVTPDGNYQVIHNDRIFLLDKHGRLRALYANFDTNKKIISDIVSLVEADM